MIKINLLSKKPKRDTLQRLRIQLSAANKWVAWHNKRIIMFQKDEIECLKNLLRLHGVNI